MHWAERDYREQVEWMRKCGGTREGYRTIYSAHKGSHFYADSIYYADLAALDKAYELFLRVWDGSHGIDYDWYARAVEVLGESYFE